MRRALVLLVLLLPTTAAAQVPSDDWRSVRTAHFRIHYPKPFEPWALRMAGRIDAIHDRVAAFVGHRPDRIIEAVVLDPAAEANGMAFPFLDRPSIILYTHPPESESSIGFFDDWTELLVTHEVAHVAHLDRPRNRSRAILARLSPFPLGPIALRAPRFVTEGYATLVEGELTGSGRPHGSFRTMVLRRFAMDGKLPTYGALSKTSGWMGASMAYLVGSTFLEWLERRQPGGLSDLWKRLASRRRTGFSGAFKAVYGEHARDLYDRFAAETTAAAIEEEQRLREAGIREGDLWQRFEGVTSTPEVSPDGKQLLVGRLRERDGGELCIYTIEPTPEERKEEARDRARAEELLRDPNEVADRPERPRQRRPSYLLPSVNGRVPSDGRFVGDGKRVLFSRAEPDAHGVRHDDLFLWEPASGRVRRITREADVAMADPAPHGDLAIGVRSRYGASELVRIDLATGSVTPLAEPMPAGVDVVWNHPRISPDGRTVAALCHRGSGFQLVTLPADGSAALDEPPLDGNPVGPPAWSHDGRLLYVATDRDGIWNVAAIDPVSRGEVKTLTRVAGGAYAPAPTPDGRSLFFLDLDTKGIDVRVLPLDGNFAAVPPAEPTPRPPEASSPGALAGAATSATEVYRARSSHTVRSIVTFVAGPAGVSIQGGAEGSDVVGRLDWIACLAVGDRALPWGASLAAAWRGFPVTLFGQAFAARERPGEQALLRRSDRDSDRVGAFAGGRYGRDFAAGSLAVLGGIGIEQRRDPEDRTRIRRALESGSTTLHLSRVRDHLGVALHAEVQGSFGRTDGRSWSQRQARLSGSLMLSPGTLRIETATGDTSGSPATEDVFTIGGAHPASIPEGLDWNRIEVPALPAFTGEGRRFGSLRAEIAARQAPLALYATELSAFDRWRGRRPLRLIGLEARVGNEGLPFVLPGRVEAYVGLARVRAREPEIRSIAAYAGLAYRP